MTTMMESPGSGFPDSPMVDDEMVFPCKGCGEILEEGKAFELAGNRWHIECFRCNTCGTLLDSDANLLLLGDGSLICNNCTYSCSACGNKIEDLAILTGDQAFCASCFRCRNCKRKIENLRYARTSQGIFCMDCHESLMARRRKRTKASRQPSSQNLRQNKVEKSLPALPPQDGGQKNYDTVETPLSAATDYVETPDVISPRPRPSRSRKESIRDVQRDASATREEPRKDNLTLPSTRYKDNRRVSMNSEHSDVSNANNNDDGFFISMALDPNTAPGPSPHSRERSLREEPRPIETNHRDYLTKGGRLPSNHREGLRDQKSSSRSASGDREPEQRQTQTSSPHIAYQEKGRQPTHNAEWSDTMRKWKEGTANNDVARQDSGDSGFKLGDVPKSRKASRQESRSDVPPTSADSSAQVKSPVVDYSMTSSPVSADVSASPRPSSDRKHANTPPSDNSSRERPPRSDSVPTTSMKQALGRKSVEQQRSGPPTPTGPTVTNNGVSRVAETNGKPPRRSTDSPNVPSRSVGRPPFNATASSDSYLTSRTPQPQAGHYPSESASTITSSNSESVRYPVHPHPGNNMIRYSATSEFNMDEEMARVFRSEEAEKDSLMRKMSKTVSKHGRSFSDRGSRSSTAARHRPNSSLDTAASPLTGSPRSHEDHLRHELHKALQRIRELESQNTSLSERASRTVNLETADSEIHKKRATITELEASQHIVLQELEIMENHLRAAKNNKTPINMPQLQSTIMQDLQRNLDQLKADYLKEVEELISKRDALNNEIAELIQIKHKGMEEYENLNQKNLQLVELNNKLLQNYKDGSRSKHKDGHAHLFHHNHNHSHANSLDVTRSPVNANGLGIYSQHTKDKPSEGAVDLRPVPSIDTAHSSGAPTLVADADSDPHVLTAPQVVNIRKTGRPNKFTWKKGEGLTKSVTKGIRGAFGGENRRPGKDMFEAGTPYGSMPMNNPPMEIGTPTNVMKNNVEMGKGGFGFFSGQKGNVRGPGMGVQSKGDLKNSHSGTNLAEMGSGKVLFGGDLTLRCEYERMVIPTIITRCIEEVELRGMDQEGIYRKSGGTAQTKQVREGFEADGNYDISDPDLDIHSVTSAMKQYLRQMKTPLITQDSYQPFLDAGKYKDLVGMKDTIEHLPKAHRDTLEFLVFHLDRIMQHQSENLMTSNNLSVVFAPTILIPKELSQEMADVQVSREAVQFMLENCKDIFDTDA